MLIKNRCKHCTKSLQRSSIILSRLLNDLTNDRQRSLLDRDVTPTTFLRGFSAVCRSCLIFAFSMLFGPAPADVFVDVRALHGVGYTQFVSNTCH